MTYLFKEWSRTLLKDAANQEFSLITQLQEARHREYQSPREFHTYLDSLEKRFPREPEKQRALSFYAKLHYKLQDHIRLHCKEIPRTREEMVTIATGFWDFLETTSKRKRDESNEKSDSRKTSRRCHYDRPTNRSRDQEKDKDKRSSSDSPVSGVNTTSVSSDSCYNCQEEGNISRNCPKPRKEKDQDQGKGRRSR